MSQHTSTATGGQWALAFVAGSIFAVGLVLGGMTIPDNVRGFLDIAGHWRPELMGVMGGAAAVYAVAFVFARRGTPWTAAKFELPTRRDVDPKLLAGGAIFGLGWGLAGLCPGPAIVSTVTSPRVALFVVAMFVGFWLQARWETFNSRPR